MQTQQTEQSIEFVVHESFNQGNPPGPEAREAPAEVVEKPPPPQGTTQQYPTIDTPALLLASATQEPKADPEPPATRQRPFQPGRRLLLAGFVALTLASASVGASLRHVHLWAQGRPPACAPAPAALPAPPLPEYTAAPLDAAPEAPYVIVQSSSTPCLGVGPAAPAPSRALAHSRIRKSRAVSPRPEPLHRASNSAKEPPAPIRIEIMD